MKKEAGIDIFITNAKTLTAIDFCSQKDSIVLISSLSEANELLRSEDRQECMALLSTQIAKYNVTDIIFLSKKDCYTKDVLPELTQVLNQQHQLLTLLIPYKTPPVYGQREDGKVGSFILNASLYDETIAMKDRFVFWKMAYSIAYRYFNRLYEQHVRIVQLSKPQQAMAVDEGTFPENSLMVIPHKGSAKLLQRCLHYLEPAEKLPAEIHICFDDHSYRQLQKKETHLLKKVKASLYVNEPLNSGPYPARHYSITGTKQEYIFFQDSDDISTASRFTQQMSALQERGLDMIGSHELRVDQYARSLKLFRYPLDANRSLDARYYHSLFHPTAMITRSAYLKTQGFSTDRRFGYDSQFLMRAHFFLKIGNVDDFLYIRFKRPNSLTTNPQTKIGSQLRSFLLWRWRIDFKLVMEQKLQLTDSSLNRQVHQFDYSLKKIS